MERRQKVGRLWRQICVDTGYQQSLSGFPLLRLVWSSESHLASFWNQERELKQHHLPTLSGLSLEAGEAFLKKSQMGHWFKPETQVVLIFGYRKTESLQKSAGAKSNSFVYTYAITVKKLTSNSEQKML